MLTGIDLFAGGGGTTEGASKAGVRMLWAANHNRAAVDCHAVNHPETNHVCQDLHQANWDMVPSHDIMYASPCCQGHSPAAGKKRSTVKADLSRSTAWAVVSCLEAHKTPIGIIENVEAFLSWQLYDAWELAMKKLGYALSLNKLNAADMGIPQNRERLFVVATRSKSPIVLDINKQVHTSARTIVDLSFEGHEWDLVTNRVAATQNRVKNGRLKYGEIFLDAAYGSERGGRSLDKPLGTVTTVNKHSLVYGEYIRPLTIREQAAAQSFRSDYVWPTSKTLTKSMIGNAVPPKMAEIITKAVLQAA
jgi:DNA (cytosine-5)-methyltransferase 1